MAEYVLRINERSKQAKALLEYLRELSIKDKSVELKKVPNATTVAAIKAAERGDTIKLKKGEKLKLLL